MKKFKFKTYHKNRDAELYRNIVRHGIYKPTWMNRHYVRPSFNSVVENEAGQVALAHWSHENGVLEKINLFISDFDLDSPLTYFYKAKGEEAFDSVFPFTLKEAIMKKINEMLIQGTPASVSVDEIECNGKICQLLIDWLYYPKSYNVNKIARLYLKIRVNKSTTVFINLHIDTRKEDYTLHGWRDSLVNYLIIKTFGMINIPEYTIKEKL